MRPLWQRAPHLPLRRRPFAHDPVRRVPARLAHRRGAPARSRPSRTPSTTTASAPIRGMLAPGGARRKVLCIVDRGGAARAAAGRRAARRHRRDGRRGPGRPAARRVRRRVPQRRGRARRSAGSPASRPGGPACRAATSSFVVGDDSAIRGRAPPALRALAPCRSRGRRLPRASARTPCGILSRSIETPCATSASATRPLPLERAARLAESARQARRGPERSARDARARRGAARAPQALDHHARLQRGGDLRRDVRARLRGARRRRRPRDRPRREQLDRRLARAREEGRAPPRRRRPLRGPAAGQGPRGARGDRGIDGRLHPHPGRRQRVRRRRLRHRARAAPHALGHVRPRLAAHGRAHVEDPPVRQPAAARVRDEPGARVVHRARELPLRHRDARPDDDVQGLPSRRVRGHPLHARPVRLRLGARVQAGAPRARAGRGAGQLPLAVVRRGQEGALLPRPAHLGGDDRREPVRAR